MKLGQTYRQLYVGFKFMWRSLTLNDNEGQHFCGLHFHENLLEVNCWDFENKLVRSVKFTGQIILSSKYHHGKFKPVSVQFESYKVHKLDKVVEC